MNSKEESFWHKDILKAENYIKSTDFEKAKELLTELSNSNNTDCSLSARRLLGIVALNQKQLSEAKIIFEGLFQDTRQAKDILNLFATEKSLGNAKLINKYFNKAEEVLFDEIKKGKQQDTMSPINLYCYYLEALKDLKTNDGFDETLTKAIEIYKSIGVLDDHFLHTRGLPFFGSFLDLVKSGFESLGRKNDFQSWAQQQLNWVDETGKQQIKRLIPEDL